MSDKLGLRDHRKLLEFAEVAPGEVAFLRYKTAGLVHEVGSDWDVAVKNREVAGATALDCFGEPWLQVKRQYVEQRYYEWGQLDFLPIFEWNGLEFLEQDRFWAGVAVDTDSVPRPRLAHDAFVAWMTGILWGGNYKNRYDPLLKEACEVDGEEFFECLKTAFGEQWAIELWEQLEEGSPESAVDLAERLRVALFWKNLQRNGLSTIGEVIDHWRTELVLHLKPPFPWIAFLGPDGSGKSTVIDGVKAKFKESRIGMRHVHWRPTVRRGLADKPGPPVLDPHARGVRGSILSIVSLLLLVVRWWIGYPLRLWHLRAKKEIILSDRYYADLLVDPRRYRYGGPRWLARLLFKLLPKPNLTLILVAEADVIHGRKAEVALEELERQLDEYRRLSDELGSSACLVDTGAAPDVVVARAGEKLVHFLGKSYDDR